VFDVRTTNTRSAEQRETYVHLRKECENLLELARKLERLANARPDDFYDPQFQDLVNKYKAQSTEALIT
jgi:hypothetical protein